MITTLSPFAGSGFQFFDNNGKPLALGKVAVYLAGTTTPTPTYVDNSTTTPVPNTNPIVLSASGRTPAQIWIDSSLAYKFVLLDAANNIVQVNDGITATPRVDDGDQGVLFRTVQEFVNWYLVKGQTYTVDFPGAIKQKIAARFSQMISITDFGAHSITESGFSNFDSRAAIQAAIDTGAPVFIPPGVFEISGTLNLPRNTVIIGSPQFSYENYNDDWQVRIPGYGKVASIIQFRSGVHTNFFSPITSTTSAFEDTLVSGVCFRSLQTSPLDFVFAGFDGVKIENCRFENIAGAVIKGNALNYGSTFLVKDCFLVGCNLFNVSMSVADVVVDGNFFSGCRVLNYLVNTASISYTNNRHEFCTRPVAFAPGGNATITGNLFEFGHSAEIWLNGESLTPTRNVTITGNTFSASLPRSR